MTRLKSTFLETAYRHSLERKIWQQNEYFFPRQSRSKHFSLSEPTRIHTLLLRSSFHLNIPWLDWKTLFAKLHTDTLLIAKLDNDMSTFFVDNPDKNFLLFQRLLGCIHSYSSPHFIFTSHWPDWKTLFVKLHTDTLLSAKLDNDMSTFFVDKPDQYFRSVSGPSRMNTLLL